jgi:hypothetical protein
MQGVAKKTKKKKKKSKNATRNVSYEHVFIIY